MQSPTKDQVVEAIKVMDSNDDLREIANETMKKLREPKETIQCAWSWAFQSQ